MEIQQLTFSVVLHHSTRNIQQTNGGKNWNKNKNILFNNYMWLSSIQSRAGLQFIPQPAF